MNCQYIISTTKEYNTCALNLYGGKPSHGTCARCIESKENTTDFAKQLQERADQSHPINAKKVSGCCDSAKNYI
jgi:hypothetical protein